MSKKSLNIIAVLFYAVAVVLFTASLFCCNKALVVGIGAVMMCNGTVCMNSASKKEK